MKHVIIASLILVFAHLPVLAQTAVANSVRLSAVGAPWDIVIEGGSTDIKTVRTKPDGAYFLLYPGKDELNISFYIEPAKNCKTSDECRDLVLHAGNPAWGKYEGLSKARFGQFSYFEFFRPEVKGLPLQMQDMYAQYVDKGYWVDLHISKVLYTKQDRQLFERLLNSVKFVEKGTGDKNLDQIRKTADGWLKVWGEQKCKESYGALTSISREAVKEQLWMEYCKSTHMGVGKLRSRELIAAATTSSLPGKPDRSGASLRFQSEFENGRAIEFVSLTLEKDGSWTVSNYMIQEG